MVGQIRNILRRCETWTTTEMGKNKLGVFGKENLDAL